MSDVVEDRRPYSEPHQIGELFRAIPDARSLGRGSFGNVKLGYLTEYENIKVAIKSSIGSEDEEIRRLFYNEFLALQKCAGCPNIVKAYGYLAIVNEQHTVNLYNAMEKADGSVADYLKRLYRNGLPPEMLMTLICDSASALHKLHEQKLYHLDLKPANILVFYDGTGPHSRYRIAFCDLGLIREKKKDGTIGQTSPTMNTVKGTPTEMVKAIADLIKSIEDVMEKLVGKPNKPSQLEQMATSLAAQYRCLDFAAMFRMQELENTDTINKTRAPAVPSNINDPVFRNELRRYLEHQSGLLNEDIERFNANWTLYSASWTKLQPIMEAFADYRSFFHDIVHQAKCCLFMADNDKAHCNVLYYQMKKEARDETKRELRVKLQELIDFSGIEASQFLSTSAMNVL